ncbi:MAG TPA: hypothetical protein VFO39_23320 [Candidatus Sulfotelmatobacter sp.]|nr:hypothetical protein [Candidatus Sulfotelmatobacter sp.]
MKSTPQFVKASRLLLLALMVAPLATAQEARVSRSGSCWEQELTGSLAAVKNLRVKVEMGAVVVHGGSQQSINYVIHNRSFTSDEQDARRQFDSYKISAYVRGDTAWIVGDWQGRRPHKFSGEFAINVPREMALVKLETNGGSVDVTAISGRLEAETGGGSIHVDDIGGGVSAETGGGSIEVGTANGDLGLHTGGGSIEVHHANGKVVAQTGGGSVEIQSGAQDATVETGGGSVEVRQCKGKLKVSTGGGSIELGDVSGAAEINTGGGSIHLTSARGPVRASTGGGGIELMGVPSAHAETGAGGIIVKLINTGAERTDSLLETNAGDITVYIASDVAVSVRASVDLANGHTITSDFPTIHINSEGGQWGPKTISAEGSLNGGGPVLKVRTMTGDICIRRANK